jgi:hypothetical protein
MKVYSIDLLMQDLLYMKRSTKFNSGMFNARDDDYHNDSKAMTEHEISLIKHTVNERFFNDK